MAASLPAREREQDLTSQSRGGKLKSDDIDESTGYRRREQQPGVSCESSRSALNAAREALRVERAASTSPTLATQQRMLLVLLCISVTDGTAVRVRLKVLRSLSKQIRREDP